MNTIEKIKFKTWNKLIQLFQKKGVYYWLYRSYWHFVLSKKSCNTKNTNAYMTARPNPGAGIGHQMANWIAGYWFAKQFNLPFAHIPFSNSNWESFLGFGENEISVNDLLKQGYKKVRLPLFDEFNPSEMELQKKIIASYSTKKVILIAEQDQFYRDQFGVMEEIKKKFFSANSRQNDRLIYNPHHYNIAIHVRRGDIVIGQENQNPNLLMRWQGNDYFEKVLQSVIDSIKTEKPIVIYLFSQGEQKDFPEFKKFSNLHFCLEMNAQDSFLHMVYADLLITSKSSFSYKPALLSNGIKVCPKDFWHGYPISDDWKVVDENLDFLTL